VATLSVLGGGVPVIVEKGGLTVSVSVTSSGGWTVTVTVKSGKVAWGSDTTEVTTTGGPFGGAVSFGRGICVNPTEPEAGSVTMEVTTTEEAFGTAV